MKNRTGSANNYTNLYKNLIVNTNIICRMNNNLVIDMSGVTYRYSKNETTLSNIHLEVERGSIYGFLGPNGSGKTTTLSLLLGLLKNQNGSIKIFGEDLRSNRLGILRRIGALIESPSIYGHLTAKENLEVYREVYGAPKNRVAEVLKIVGLEDTGKKTAKKFSLGMKQRLAIALALLPNPELLILDEPSNGLDPAGIIELRELIKMLNREYGMTILISSHILSEVEKMVSHVGIIYKGKLLFQGSLRELHQFQKKGSKLAIKTSDNDFALHLLYDYDPQKEGETIFVPFEDAQQVSLVQKILFQNNLDVYLLQPKESDLEQLFIDLTSTHS